MLGTGYLTRLGHFVETFAEVEETLHAFLAHLAGLDQTTAIVLLSGSRINTDMGFVRRLYDARKQPMPPALDKAFKQLVEINNVRNLLLHHGTVTWRKQTEDGWEYGRSTSDASRKLHNPKRYQVSAQLLEQMIADLGGINLVMMLVAGTTHIEKQTPEESLKRFEQWTWRCKLPPQESKNPQTQRNRPKPQRPPRSSRA